MKEISTTVGSFHRRGLYVRRWVFNTLFILLFSRCTSAFGGENPFGVMLGAPEKMSVETKIRTAKKLGAACYRTTAAVFTSKWNGFDAECDAAQKEGFKLILTVRNGDGPGGKGGPSPSMPPENIGEYKRILGDIIDKCGPSVLVVENEENSMALFYGGSPAEYHRQLKAACEVAHGKGIKCANGGLVSSLVIALAAEQHKKEGDSEKAEKLLSSALDKDSYRKFKKGGDRLKEQLKRGGELLAGYKEAGADFVNFHWYSDNPEALAAVAEYLKKTAGLPVICNEMGQQKNTNPAHVAAMMEKSLDLKIPIVIWYSIDTPAFGEARGLTEADGTLRPNGEAFKKLIEERNFRRTVSPL